MLSKSRYSSLVAGYPGSPLHHFEVFPHFLKEVDRDCCELSRQNLEGLNSSLFLCESLWKAAYMSF